MLEGFIPLFYLLLRIIWIYSSLAVKNIKVNFILFCSFVRIFVRIKANLPKFLYLLFVRKIYKELIGDKYNNDIKQTWLAERLGKSFCIVNSYVCNRRQPSLDVLFEIVKILDVAPKELIVNNKNIYLYTFLKM